MINFASDKRLGLVDILVHQREPDGNKTLHIERERERERERDRERQRERQRERETERETERERQRERETERERERPPGRVICSVVPYNGTEYLFD